MSHNLINVDYMKILWQKCAAGFIYGLVIIDDNDDSISFARTKRVFEHYNYIKRHPNEAPDIYGLWLSLADCLALKYYNGIGCDVDYKKAHELIKITSQAGRVLGSFLKAHQYFYGNGVNRNIELAKNTLKEVIDGTNDSPELFWRGKAIELLETIEDGESYAVEDEYLDMVKEMLEDGQISDRERRLLEKLRVKLGISEERAAELEASLSASQLAEEEQDYLNEYREILSDDGEISPRERKLLDKIARMNGISPERVRELESMA